MCQRFLLLSLVFTLATSAPAFAVAPDAIEATITVSNNPYALAIAPNGTFAYVSNFATTSISRINLTTNTFVASITTPDSGGREIAFTSDSAFAYSCSGNNLLKIRTSDNTITATIALSGCWGVAVAPNDSFVYVGTGSNQLWRVSVSANTATVINTTFTMYGGAFTPDGAFAYWAEYGTNGSIAKIRTSDNTIVARLAGMPWAWKIAISPNGQIGYATSYSTTNSLRKFSTATDTFTATYSLNRTQGLGFTPDGAYLYVSDLSAGKIQKINTATDAMTQAANGSTSMYYYAVSSTGTFALGANYAGNSVIRYYLNNTVTPSSLALMTSGSSSFRTNITVTASLGVAGSDGAVTFFANGKKIPRCIKRVTSSLSVSCTFKPATRGSLSITAVLVPTNTLYSASTSVPLNLAVGSRSGSR